LKRVVILEAHSVKYRVRWEPRSNARRLIALQEEGMGIRVGMKWNARIGESVLMSKVDLRDDKVYC